jgi:hypothetical protein
VRERDEEREAGVREQAPEPGQDRAVVVWNGTVARPEPTNLETQSEPDERQRAFWTLPAFRQRVQT